MYVAELIVRELRRRGHHKAGSGQKQDPVCPRPLSSGHGREVQLAAADNHPGEYRLHHHHDHRRLCYKAPLIPIGADSDESPDLTENSSASGIAAAMDPMRTIPPLASDRRDCFVSMAQVLMPGSAQPWPRPIGK